MVLGREREREGGTGGGADKQTGRQTYRQTDTESGRAGMEVSDEKQRQRDR